MNGLFELFNVDILFSIACIFCGYSRSSLRGNKEFRQNKALYDYSGFADMWWMSILMILYIIIFIFILSSFGSIEYKEMLMIYIVGSIISYIIGSLIFWIIISMPFIRIINSIISPILGVLTFLLPILDLLIKLLS